MRRTATPDTLRQFVQAGMRLCSRDSWVEFLTGHSEAMSLIWDLCFVRRGVTAAGAHFAGDVHGVPTVETRALKVNMNVQRHRALILCLGHLGLGLITGHRMRGESIGHTLWYLHDLRLVQADRVPRGYRRGIEQINLTPLLPGHLDLHRMLVSIYQGHDNVSAAATMGDSGAGASGDELEGDG